MRTTTASTWAWVPSSEPARRWLGVGLALVAAIIAGSAPARGTYQEPAAFLAETFADDVPAPRKLWVTGSLRDRVRDALGHDLGVLRVRYWKRDDRSAWILEEIGKERPITTGLVVDGGRLDRIRVLIYRESRGWEVRHPWFTAQFQGARLTTEDRLDRHIDGISGATLSVNALTRLARVALLLHERTERSDGD